MTKTLLALVSGLFLAACNTGDADRVAYDFDPRNEFVAFCSTGDPSKQIYGETIIVGFDLSSGFVDVGAGGSGNRFRTIAGIDGFLALKGIVFPKKKAIIELAKREEVRDTVDDVDYLITYTEMEIDGKVLRKVSSFSFISERASSLGGFITITVNIAYFLIKIITTLELSILYLDMMIYHHEIIFVVK